MNEEFIKDLKSYGFKENGILPGYWSFYIRKTMYLAYNPDGFYLTINNLDPQDVTEELSVNLKHVNNIARVQALYFELTNKTLKRIA